SYDILIDDLKSTQAYVLKVEGPNLTGFDVKKMEIRSHDIIQPHIVAAKKEDKAFRLPGFISFGKGNGGMNRPRHVDVWEIPNCYVICDQGSELNLITPALAQLLHMPLYKIQDGMCTGMSMRSANGEFNPLQHFVTCDFEIDGIYREISAFPWIWTVHAVPDVRDGTLHFGDETTGERRKVLHTTNFFESKYQKLLLIPDLPQYRERVEIAEKIMEEQVPLQSAKRPVTSYQREYYVEKNRCRYEYEPVAKISTGKKQRSCEQNSGFSTESYLTDQYDTTIVSETEPASTSSEEADSESDL
ncbi:hypothetical protein K3495_g15065, partial [Podosphaera aphanis]